MKQEKSKEANSINMSETGTYNQGVRINGYQQPISSQILSIGDMSGSIFFTHKQSDIQSATSTASSLDTVVDDSFNWRVIMQPKMIMLGTSLTFYVMGSSIVYQCLPPLANEIGSYKQLCSINP